MRAKMIDELVGEAWNNAIDNTADVVRRTLGVTYNTLGQDKYKIEDLALKLKVQFDENGEIV